MIKVRVIRIRVTGRLGQIRVRDSSSSGASSSDSSSASSSSSGSGSGSGKGQVHWSSGSRLDPYPTWFRPNSLGLGYMVRVRVRGVE